MTTRVSYNLKDALLIKETDFPAAAGTVQSEVLDLGSIGDRGVRTDPFELLISAPAATAAELPDGATNTFSYQFCDTADFSANVQEVSLGTIAQTGSATGAEEFEIRFRVATRAC